MLKLYDWFWSDCLELPGYTSAVAAAVGGVAAAAVGWASEVDSVDRETVDVGDGWLSSVAKPWDIAA